VSSRRTPEENTMDDQRRVTPPGGADGPGPGWPGSPPGRDDEDADGPAAAAEAEAAAAETAAETAGAPADDPAAGEARRPPKATRPDGYEPL
jgi:hypothetical protein